MNDEEKVALSRKGNEFFNNGNMTEAIKYFVKAGYRDGIMRVADYYFYDKKQPLIALKFYKMINRKDRIDEINARMMFAFNKMLSSSKDDSGSEAAAVESKEEIEVKIHPKLRLLAEEIIRDNKEGK
ncbi:MAG: hypothetical protein CVV49_05730 [Spirochaetae bacterium HGW-Spirochaetae-5]|nr:MAG: hypothetical protein CVV49_05730 [Spirochaetae bacterium HGW-Spirochaetae-5]